MKTTTFLGKLTDTLQHLDESGVNVMLLQPNWTPEMNHEFIRQAIERGDDFKLISADLSGYYAVEVQDLINTLVAEVRLLRAVTQQNLLEQWHDRM